MAMNSVREKIAEEESVTHIHAAYLTLNGTV